MAIEINHLFESNVPDGEDNNLVQPSDWNANHVLSGGGIFRVPQLIEEKVVSAGTTTVTFSGLDGDVDGEYLVTWDVVITTSGSDEVLYVNPNGVTTNLRSTCSRWWGSSGDTVGYTDKWGFFRHGGAGVTLQSFGKCYINPKTGVYRKYNGNFVSRGPTETLHGIFGGNWEDTGANITSLVFGRSGGSFSGTIRLYKMVDLNLGGE